MIYVGAFSAEVAQLLKSTHREIEGGGGPHAVCKSLNRYISAADCLISLIFRRIFVHGLCVAIESASAAAAETDDFPTPESLRDANSGYKQGATEKDETGRVVPSPAVRTKQQIFRPSDYKSIDDRACQVLN